MATEKRARQRANRQLKQEELEREIRRDRARQYGYVAAVVGVMVVAAIALFVVAGGDDDPQTATETAQAGDTGQADTSDAADPAADTADADTTDADTDEPAAEPTPCPAADGSSERVLDFPAPPPDCLTEGAAYTAILDTTSGEIVAELDPDRAPATVNNFVYLARYHYYDGSTFHRVIEDFVIQGGDPNGEPPGTGGPGYTIDEEVPEPGEYQLGSLVMAKRNPPSTTGAQFFIVTGPDGEALPNQFSLFGQVTEGLDVATAIQSVDTAGADQPIEDVVINSITIVEN